MTAITVSTKGQKANGLHPIFADCCCKDNPFWAMETPYVVGGTIYATDGRIVSRCKHAQFPDFRWEGADGLRRPIPDTLPLSKRKYRGEPIALPTVSDKPATEVCTRCYGKRRERKGARGICPDCSGAGTVEISRPLDIGRGAVRMRERYIRILRRHGAVLYPPRKKGGLTFRFEIPGTKIDGLVMGVSDE